MKNICRFGITFGFSLLFILVPLILTPLNYELFEYNKMMLTYGLTVFITLSWLGLMISEKRIYIAKTPFDLPIFLFFLSQFIATLFSMDPHVSWFGYYSRFNGGMMSVISYILLYYAFVSNFSMSSQLRITNSELVKNKSAMGNPQSINLILLRFLQIILLTGLIVSVYGILEHFGIDKNLWVQDVQSRIFSTLGQPNWLAAYVVALIPLAMGFTLKSQSSSTKSQTNSHFNASLVWNLKFVIWSVTVLLFFLTLLWTRSRSGLLAFGVSDILFWYLVFAPPRAWWKQISMERITSFVKRNWTARLCVAFHAIIIGIVILNGVYIPSLDRWITVAGWRDRIVGITTSEATGSAETPVTTGPVLETGGTESTVIRKYVWEAAINAWKSSPKTILIGTGTETFAFAFYQFKPVGHNLTSEWDFLYNKAHNEFLNYLATTGILGLGTYLFLIGSVIYWFIKSQITKLNIQTNPNAQNLILRVALFSGWISILITNFFGFSVVVMQLLFFLFPALLVCLTRPDDTDDQMPDHLYDKTLSWKRLWQITALIILGIVLLFSLLVLAITWQGDTLFAQGYHLSRMGYGQGYKKLKAAIVLNPSEPFYHDELGTALAELALTAWTNEEATLAADLAKESIQENEIALAISPNNVNFWKTRTKILYTLSAMNETFLDDAITALTRAETLSPMDPKILYNLAILYGRAGLLDKGIDALVRAKELKPNYRDAYYGLAVFYKEKNQPEQAASILNEYLTNIDATDKEFKELIGQ